MNHLRVIKKDNIYYVQRRYRFLFWHYWTELDAYGRPANASGLRPMEFDNEYSAIDAMERCTKNDKEYNSEEIQVIKTLDY